MCQVLVETDVGMLSLMPWQLAVRVGANKSLPNFLVFGGSFKQNSLSSIF